MSDIKAKYEASCVYSAVGKEKRLNGHLMFNPSGSLVKVRPGTVRLSASVEKGVFLLGLKPGWRLASKADSEAQLKARKKPKADAKDKPKADSK